MQCVCVSVWPSVCWIIQHHLLLAHLDCASTVAVCHVPAKRPQVPVPTRLPLTPHQLLHPHSYLRSVFVNPMSLKGEFSGENTQTGRGRERRKGAIVSDPKPHAMQGIQVTEITLHIMYTEVQLTFRGRVISNEPWNSRKLDLGIHDDFASTTSLQLILFFYWRFRFFLIPFTLQWGSIQGQVYIYSQLIIKPSQSMYSYRHDTPHTSSSSIWLEDEMKLEQNGKTSTILRGLGV